MFLLDAYGIAQQSVRVAFHPDLVGDAAVFRDVLLDVRFVANDGQPIVVGVGPEGEDEPKEPDRPPVEETGMRDHLDLLGDRSCRGNRDRWRGGWSGACGHAWFALEVRGMGV